MCGIAGIVGALASAERVQSMTNAQAHRGPDGDGVWAAPGVALGHRRLAILDLSEAGRQPMTTPDGRYTMIFNGEVYSYKEIRARLKGVHFKSESDTEVILHAYAQWGPECLEHFVGMYALAIWDRDERTLFCARDRLGIKPFYYTQLGDSFAFSSELRGLFVAGAKASLNAPVLYDFLARDFYEHRDDTFFEGIYKLPPGHWMMVKDGKPTEPRRYWSLAEEAAKWSISPDPEAREEKLLELSSLAIKEHLQSDVPVGIALSGGLDSAILLALLDKAHPNPTQVEAFSFAFEEEAYSERPFVEMMAKHTGRKAHFSEVSAQTFADTALRFVKEQEEPFAGAPISAYSLCYELARKQGFIVMMDGSGVDEGLAGYGRFRPALWADMFLAGDWQNLDCELACAGVNTDAQRRRALEQMHEAMQPVSDVGKGQDLTMSIRPDCLTPEFVEAAKCPVMEFERPFEDNLRNLMYRELRYTKLPRALRFRDRLSMGVSTELRPPFLDHRLLAYEFALPAEDRISKGVSKAILRRAANRTLPDAVRLASKRSVQTPQREWFRSELREWVREHIDTPSFWGRGWVEKKAGVAAMEAFFRGEGDNSFFLWQWINLEMWAQTTLDNATKG